MNNIPKPSQMNPDSSSGMYVTSELSLSTRTVSNNKEQYDKDKVVKRVETDLKITFSNKERKEAYNMLFATIFKPKGNIMVGIPADKNTVDTKRIYQHLGEKLSNLPNVKK